MEAGDRSLSGSSIKTSCTSSCFYFVGSGFRHERVLQYLNSISVCFKEKAKPLSKVVSFATDGARAMFGQYMWFDSLLEEEISSVLLCIV